MTTVAWAIRINKESHNSLAKTALSSLQRHKDFKIHSRRRTAQAPVGIPDCTIRDGLVQVQSRPCGDESKGKGEGKKNIPPDHSLKRRSVASRLPEDSGADVMSTSDAYKRRRLWLAVGSLLVRKPEDEAWLRW